MKRPQHQQSIWTRYKEWWITSGCLLGGLVLVGGLVTWNVLSWQQYEQSFTHWHDTLKVKTDQALTLPAKTTEDRTKKRLALAAIQQVVDHERHTCDAYPLLHWQQFMSTVKAKLVRCSELVAKDMEFGSRLDSVMQYLISEESTTTLLTTGAATKLDQAAWRQQPAHWATIVDQLTKQSSPRSFEQVLQVSKVKVGDIRQAWQLLVAADDAKDRAKYDEATAKLTAAYGGLGDVATQSEKSFAPLMSALETSYKSSF